MKVVEPITVDTFRPFAKLGKSNSKIQSRICDLLFRLVQTDDPAKVKALCESEIEWLSEQYEAASTRTSYVSAYRKAIRAYFVEHGIPGSLRVEKQTSKGAVVNHLAESYLMASADDYAAVRQTSKVKTAAQRDNLTGFDAAAALEATEQALQSEDWRELAAALIMATQSRPSDMLQSGEFKAISRYRLEFTSRAKKRGAIVKGEIFCLVDTATFIDAFSRLRREPDVMEMRGWALKDVDSGKNATLNRAVKRIYGDIIPVPFGEKELSCKNLRASGVNVAYWLHGRDSQSLGRFAELQLLHDNPGTAANYEDFYCCDADGRRLMEIGIFEDAPLTTTPKSEKRSSLSLDKQLLSMIGDAEQWGEGSHADRLERIIARAKQADRLERQLARECEKRQRLELELKRSQQQVEATKDTPYDRLSWGNDDGSSSETSYKDFTIYSVSDDKGDYWRIVKGSNEDLVKEGWGESTLKEYFNSSIANIKPSDEPAIEADSSAFDWRSVPNEVLKGDRHHDAYPEKLRRSVEAIQEYNAGRDDSEQFAITGSLLRQLSKVKPGLVKEWTAEHKAELDAYNAGYGARQNTGKPDPREAIKWSEVYGKYEW